MGTKAKASPTNKSKKLTPDKPSASKKIKKAAWDATKAAKDNTKGKKSVPPKQKVPVDEGYNDEEYHTFKALCKEVDERFSTKKELQDILRKNDQKITGSREELVERVADGELFGKIPRCPLCFEGHLQYNYKRGLYICPGFWEKDHFRRCKAAFDRDFIQREQWVE